MIKKVGFIVIGDEILNGKTTDKNINFLAKSLDEYGFDLVEVRVIGDVFDTIVETVKHFSKKYDYVFTCGGIGGTHDDITFACVASAFGLEIEQNQEALRRLSAYYKERELPLTDTRINLAKMPKGCKLIDNSISIAPGANVENVYVCAGIPKIFNVMLNDILPTMLGGVKVHKYTIFKENLSDGTIGDTIAKIASSYDDVSIGSYPKFHDNGFSTEIVMRSRNKKNLDLCYKDIKSYIDKC